MTSFRLDYQPPYRTAKSGGSKTRLESTAEITLRLNNNNNNNDDDDDDNDDDMMIAMIQKNINDS